MATGGGVKEVGVRLKVGATGADAVDKLGAALRRVGTDTQTLDAKAQALGVEMATTAGTSDKLAQAQDKLAPATRDAAKAAEDLSTAALHGGAGLATLGGGSDTARRKLGDMKLELAAAGAAAYTIGRALGSAAKDAAAFETRMAEVGTLVSDTSGMTAQAEAVRALTRQYGGEAPAQARALYQIISAGAKEGAEATRVLDQANRLAVGGVTDITTAADGLTSVLNAYGEKAGTVQQVSDAMFVAMKSGKTTVGELSSSIGQVAPIAAQAGVALDQLLAATAALTKGGTSTSESMTQLRGLITAIIKPSSEAATIAAELGIAFDAQALKAKGLAGFLEEVKAKTGGNTEVLAKLFGSVEALGAVLALTGSQAGSFSQVLQDMQTSAGATDKAFGKMAQTSGFAGRQFQAALDDARISMGQALTALTPLVQAVTSAINLFNQMPDSTRAATAGMVAVGLVVGPLALAVGSLTRAVGLAATALGVTSATAAASVAPLTAAAGATGVLARAVGVLGTALRVATGPIGLVLAGVSLLVPEFLRAKQAAEDGDEAVRKMLAGPDKPQLPAKADDAAKAIAAVGNAATLAESKHQALEVAARLAATALGVDMAAATNKVSLEFGKQLGHLDRLIAGLPTLKAAGVDTGKVVAEALGKMIDGAKNEAEVEALRTALEKLGNTGEQSGEQITKGLEKVGKKLDELKPGVNSLSESLKTFGLSSRQEAQETATKYESAYRTISASANVSLQDQATAFKKWRSTALEASGGVVSGQVELQGKMLQNKIDAAGLGDSISLAMTKGKRSTDAATGSQNDYNKAVQQSNLVLDEFGLWTDRAIVRQRALKKEYESTMEAWDKKNGRVYNSQGVREGGTVQGAPPPGTGDGAVFNADQFNLDSAHFARGFFNGPLNRSPDPNNPKYWVNPNAAAIGTSPFGGSPGGLSGMGTPSAPIPAPSSSTVTVNINLGGRAYAVQTASQSAADALLEALRAAEKAAGGP